MTAAPAGRSTSEHRSSIGIGGAELEALDGELLPPANTARRHLPSAEELALGEQVRAEHEVGERSMKDAVKHFRKCGVALLRAKAALGHGHFTYFLKSMAKLHPRMAQRYMMLARELARLPAADATRVSQLSLRDAIGELSRTSCRAAKLPPAALDRALADARRESVKRAVIKAVNGERYEPLSGTLLIASPRTDTQPAVPAPTMSPHVASLVRAIERTIRVYAESYPEMEAASVGVALGEVWERIQDEARMGASEARL